MDYESNYSLDKVNRKWNYLFAELPTRDNIKNTSLPLLRYRSITIFHIFIHHINYQLSFCSNVCDLLLINKYLISKEFSNILQQKL